MPYHTIVSNPAGIVYTVTNDLLTACVLFDMALAWSSGADAADLVDAGFSAEDIAALYTAIGACDGGPDCDRLRVLDYVVDLFAASARFALNDPDWATFQTHASNGWECSGFTGDPCYPHNA